MAPEFLDAVDEQAPPEPQDAALHLAEGPNDIEGPNDEIVRRAFFWSLGGLIVAGAAGLYAWLLWAPIEAGEPPFALAVADPKVSQIASLPAEAFPRVPYTDVTDAAGIKFKHFSGARGDLLMPELAGPGCGFFDLDNDGDQDIVLVNGTPFPGQPAVDPPPTLKLYRNRGDGTFVDVTAGSGLDITCYGMGVAFGDYDADGRTDVFLTAVGSNRLFRNTGDGKFRETTATAGVAGEPHRWSTSAGFFDYDRDGDLDLFVCNYVDWSEERDRQISFKFSGLRDYLPPWSVAGTHCYLYQNHGDGTFADVSAAAGIQVSNQAQGTPLCKAFGVSFRDFDDDGWVDIVVANDTVQSCLFRNLADGNFEEIGHRAGLGFAHSGKAASGMGIDVAMLREGQWTVAMSNIFAQPTAMFTSQDSKTQFLDTVQGFGMAADTLPNTSWGLFFFDADLDGRLDQFQCSGSVLCEPCAALAGRTYLEKPQLFWNRGPDQSPPFAQMPVASVGEVFDRPLMARGAAYADIDGDGDLDILIAQKDRPALLLRNDQRLGHHYLRFKLVGGPDNREAIGARVEVRTGTSVQRQEVMPTRSYLSQVELPVTFGLGSSKQVDAVEVVWPDGTRQEVKQFQLNGLTVVKKIKSKS